jgi:hypothetical protein
MNALNKFGFDLGKVLDFHEVTRPVFNTHLEIFIIWNKKRRSITTPEYPPLDR